MISQRAALEEISAAHNRRYGALGDEDCVGDGAWLAVGIDDAVGMTETDGGAAEAAVGAGVTGTGVGAGGRGSGSGVTGGGAGGAGAMVGCVMALGVRDASGELGSGLREGRAVGRAVAVGLGLGESVGAGSPASTSPVGVRAAVAG